MGKGEGDNMKFLTGLAVLCCGILSAAAAEASRLTFVKTACAAGISARVENPGNLEILATGNQPWRGIHLRPEQGEHWDFSGFGSFECEVENRNQDGFCGVAFYMNDQLLGRSSIRPGETKPLRFRLNHAGPSRFDPGFPPGSGECRSGFAAAEISIPPASPGFGWSSSHREKSGFPFGTAGSPGARKWRRK